MSYAFNKAVEWANLANDRVKIGIDPERCIHMVDMWLKVARTERFIWEDPVEDHHPDISIPL